MKPSCIDFASTTPQQFIALSYKGLLYNVQTVGYGSTTKANMARCDDMPVSMLRNITATYHSTDENGPAQDLSH